MDYTKEIQELKKKRKKLEEQLETKGISAEERLLIRQQIITIGQEITALYNSQAGATSAAAPKCWKLSIVFKEGARCLELRKKVFLHAQECYAYDATVKYTTNKKGLIDATSDLECVMYFKLEESALKLQNYAKHAEDLYRLPKPIITCVEEDATHVPKTRVWSSDYGKQSQKSPNRTAWDTSLIHRSVSEQTSEDHATSVNDPQTIELESPVDCKKTRHAFHSCIIIPHANGGSDSDDANRIPLPSDWHEYFDGRHVTKIPAIDIVSTKFSQRPTAGTEGRHAVVLEIWFADSLFEAELAMQLRGTRKQPNGSYSVTVQKRNPLQFQKNLAWRHNQYFGGTGSRKRQRE